MMNELPPAEIVPDSPFVLTEVFETIHNCGYENCTKTGFVIASLTFPRPYSETIVENPKEINLWLDCWRNLLKYEKE